MMFPGNSRASSGVTYLLIANAAVYALQIMPFVGGPIEDWGALVPAIAFGGGQVWRVITYMFLHGNIWHILFNLLMLWMFGVELEEIWGARRFVAFYFIGGIGAGLFSAITWHTPIIGASGAVLAVMTASASLFPERKVLLFFVIPMSMRMTIVLYAVASIWLGVSGGGGGIAHVTHLGGIVVALAYLKFYPAISAMNDRRAADRAEKKRRAWLEEALRNDRRYETVIDPILKKISERGMASLTRKEKAILKRASAPDKERIRKSTIVPLDPFR